MTEELAVPEGPDPDLTIYQRMLLILGELPAIGKTQENKQQGFHYRGHDDVMNALNPLLAKHGVFFVPDVLERVTAERKTRQGGTMYEVNLHVRYTFFGVRGDEFTASAWGEGTDTGDKSTNKAMTMALKNVLAQTFALATAELSDADAETPEETTGRQLPGQFKELEALIEEVKAADPDPAHGGGYYYQVAVNAAAKYHEKRLEDLAPGELHDLERRFRWLLEGFEKPQESPEGDSNALPLEESIVRTEGPEVKVAQNWAEVKEAIDAYHSDLWADFRVFVEQAGAHLFPEVPEKERTKAQRDVLFQAAAGVTVRLLETHAPTEFPPPVRIELQAHWSKVLGGQVLDGPPWAMDADEVAAGRPPRTTPQGSRGEEAEASQPPAEEKPTDTPVAEEASPSPLEQTVTDAPLTDGEQQVLDAAQEEFPGATEVPNDERDWQPEGDPVQTREQKPRSAADPTEA